MTINSFNEARKHRSERGGVSAEHLAIICGVVFAGIAGLTQLGGAMQQDIEGDTVGAQVQPVAVGRMAGQAEPNGSATLVTGADGSVSVTGEAADGSGSTSDESIRGADSEDHGNGGGFFDSVLSLPGNAANFVRESVVDTFEDARDFGGSVLSFAGQAIGFGTDVVSSGMSFLNDAADTVASTLRHGLGTAERFVGGLIDGAWDAVFEFGRGILVLGKTVIWDFGVEDLVVGVAAPFIQDAAWFHDAIVQGGPRWSDNDLSRIPLKDAAESVWHFATHIPSYARGVWDTGFDLGLNAVNCVKPWGGQSAQDRGHACGDVLPTAAALIFGFGEGRALGMTGRQMAGGASIQMGEIVGARGAFQYNEGVSVHAASADVEQQIMEQRNFVASTDERDALISSNPAVLSHETRKMLLTQLAYAVMTVDNNPEIKDQVLPEITFLLEKLRADQEAITSARAH